MSHENAISELQIRRFNRQEIQKTFPIGDLTSLKLLLGLSLGDNFVFLFVLS